MSIIDSAFLKKQEQLTFDHQSRRTAEREFLQSREEIFTAETSTERFNAVTRCDKARQLLILEFGYSLEQLAKLVDEYENSGDAA